MFVALLAGCNSEHKVRRAKCEALGGMLVLSNRAHTERRDICIRRDVVLGEM